MRPTQTLGPFPGSAQDLIIAKEAGEAIAGFVNGDAVLKVDFTRSTGERIQTSIPVPALKMLADILADMAQGHTVTLVPYEAELTTHQAAELLRVSRPFLIKLLDQGVIEHRKVGRHRRIRSENLQAYIENEKKARRATLAELAAYDQEIGIDDIDAE